MKILVVTILFWASLGFGADFMALCLSKKRPRGFDELIRLNFKDKISAIEFTNSESCANLSREVAKATTVTLPIPVDEFSWFAIFPALSLLDLRTPKKITQINFGRHPDLLLFTLTGPLELTDLGDLLESKLLDTLAFHGVGKSSTLDAKQLAQFPDLGIVGFSDLTLINAKTLESLPKLTHLSFDHVRLDKPLDWSQFKKLEKKEIK